METAGVVVGGVALATLFSTCMECFEYVESSRHYGIDFERSLVKLEIVRWRLQNWGRAVLIQQDSNQGNSRDRTRVASQEEEEKVKYLLDGILHAFKEAEKLSDAFKTPAEKQTSNRVATTVSRKSLNFRDRIRERAILRQNTTSWNKKVAWALHSAAALDKLIADITYFVDGLVDLFPGTQEAMQKIAQPTISDVIGNDEESISRSKLLAQDAEGVDNAIKAAAEREGYLRSTYRNIKNDVSGGGQVMMGNVNTGGSSATTGPSGHYEGIENTVKSNAQVLIGSSDQPFFRKN